MNILTNHVQKGLVTIFEEILADIIDNVLQYIEVNQETNRKTRLWLGYERYNVKQ